MAPRRLSEVQIRRIVLYPFGRDSRQESDASRRFRDDLERARMDSDLLAIWNEYCYQWDGAGTKAGRLTRAMNATLTSFGNGPNNGLRRRVISALNRWCDEHPSNAETGENVVNADTAYAQV